MKDSNMKEKNENIYTIYIALSVMSMIQLHYHWSKACTGNFIQGHNYSWWFVHVHRSVVFIHLWDFYLLFLEHRDVVFAHVDARHDVR